MEPGRERRNLIKSLLEQDPSVKIPVDSEHCLQVHKDPDLRKLVKEGFLVKDRESWGSETCRKSYLYHPAS
jgi:hypothetical protein